MRVDLFDFDLPQELIALRPAQPRSSAKLLQVMPLSGLKDLTIADLPRLLRSGDALVLNDTKVFPAELKGYRVRGEAKASVNFNLHKKTGASRWLSFARPAKKLATGDVVEFGNLTARVLRREEAEVELEFSLEGDALQAAFKNVGIVPLPPYIALKRGADTQDKTDYQTIFAKDSGSVAAPTAGLHFTDELMNELSQAGVQFHYVTLHVGAGTFLPVKSDDTSEHKMHSEWGSISAKTAQSLNAVREKGGRLVCVGTTSLRLLESASTDFGKIEAFEGETAIFITPGYRFRAADALITNFHLPRSTLFMLVSAFSGLDVMREAYAHAITSHYRFYSYGDACLLYPKVAK